MNILIDFLSIVINIYMYTIIIYIFMGYFEQTRYSRFYQFLRNICEPILKPFSVFSFSGISFAPLFAIMLLQIIQNLLSALY
jgi:YggT family protein